jgi:hypothetical protein
MEDKGRQAERVIAVEMRQENGIDGARIHAAAVHVGEKRCAPIQEQTSVNHHGAVVPLGREGSAGAQKS